ncbi:MAG: hypothetical protein ABI699_02540 [Caldimonas sp.]
MNKSLPGLLALFVAAGVPATASASCFFVYGPKNQLVYRSTITPVDLSRPISESLRGRFSGGHLVMIPDETGCPDLLAAGESKLYATLGFSTPGAARSTSAIEASPLFRNVRARPSGDSTDPGSTTRNDASGRPIPPRSPMSPPPGVKRGR